MSNVQHATDIPAHTIVVGYDGSPSARDALDWAVDQAVAERRPLTIAYAASPSDSMWMDQAGFDQRTGERARLTVGQGMLAEARAAATSRAPDLEIHDLLRAADPRDVLIRASQDAASVVLGSRGRGPVRSLLLGSVGVAVTRHAQCPVIVHRPSKAGVEREGILVGVDTTEASMPVLEYAFDQASLRRQPLTVAYAFWQAPAVTHTYTVAVPPVEDPVEQELAVAECLSGMSEKYPDVTVTREFLRGLADVALVQRGDTMDLLIVGSHHGGAASQILFGSVAASVLEHATCPVAVVPTS